MICLLCFCLRACDYPVCEVVLFGFVLCVGLCVRSNMFVCLICDLLCDVVWHGCLSFLLCGCVFVCVCCSECVSCV